MIAEFIAQPWTIEIPNVAGDVVGGLMLAAILGTLAVVKKWPSRALHAWKKRGHFWEHVEAHITGFEIEPKTKVSGDARLEVRVCNFTRHAITATLLIENWAVAGCAMPRADIASPVISIPPGKSGVLTVHGSPSSDDLTRLEGPVPLMARVREGYPVTLPVTVEGWLTLTMRKSTSRLQFKSTFDYGKVRLMQPPSPPRATRASFYPGPDEFGL